MFINKRMGKQIVMYSYILTIQKILLAIKRKQLLVQAIRQMYLRKYYTHGKI